MCVRPRLSYRRVLFLISYICMLCVQVFFWPVCDNLNDLEQAELDEELGPLPSNILDPPIWSHDLPHPLGGGGGSCGPWQKSYTHMHRAMLAGELPPSYLVYTTGQGFPPIISGVPEAMKGIATVFMLALLTDRAFVLDWKSPTGFNQVLVPRYINWRFDSVFEDDPTPILHVHDIGSKHWIQTQNKSVWFYEETDFNSYFSNEREVIQAHSFDFTFALLRNRHFRKKAKELGLDGANCRLCCIWHYLFKHSGRFQRNTAITARKRLGLTPENNIIFVDFSFPLQSLPRSLLIQQIRQVFDCVERIKPYLHKPVCVVASNIYTLLEEVHKLHPSARTHSGLFYTRERYQLELERQAETTAKETPSLTIPKTEHNALMYYFMGYYLQLNSTVLFTGKKSPYSETAAALRDYYHPSGTFIVASASACKLEKYRR